MVFFTSQENELRELRVTLNQVTNQQESQKKVLDALNTQLSEKVQDLVGIHREINTALQT